MLAYELYLKNKENTEVPVKTIVPIKKVFVKIDDKVTLQLDSKTLEHYGDNVSQKDKNYYFQKSLSMPSNNLASVGLPYRGTGSAAKKPYVEFYGSYQKSKLKISIQGEKNKGTKQKVAYEYQYDFIKDKEFATVSVNLVLRLDRKSYFVDDKLLFEVYKEAGVINAEGALLSNVFLDICRAFSSFWKEKIISEDLKAFSSFSFRIVVLPFVLLPDGMVEYRCSEDAYNCSGKKFDDDCFGNLATDYPSKSTINVKFLSFDDKAFTINCKKGKEFYQNIGIGNQSFPKIRLPSDGFPIAGLEWYFFDISNPLFHFDETRSGIYDQLLSNYHLLLKSAGESAANKSAMKIICTKRKEDRKSLKCYWMRI
jgi:hypothetical protein